MFIREQVLSPQDVHPERAHGIRLDGSHKAGTSVY